MRKTFAGLLAALLILCMGTTVFAAKSVTAVDISTGVEINVKTDAMPEERKTDLKEQVVKQDDKAEVLTTVDISVPGVSSQALAKGITLTIKVPGVKPGDVIRVYHYTNGAWETIAPKTVGDGYIVVTFYSMSPVGIVKFSSADKAPASSYNNPDTDAGNKDQNNSNTDTNDSNHSKNDVDSNNTNNNTDTNTNTDSNTNNNSDTNSNNGSNDVNNTNNNNSSAHTGDNNNNNSNNVVVNVNNGTGGNSAGNNAATPKRSYSHTGSGAKYSTSPKTGAEIPVLPIIAIFAVAGVAYCGKKAKSL